MEAFVSLCGERGFGAVSIADIARRAGINRATFYRHFEDKADLETRGLDGVLTTIGDRVDEGYDAAGDDLERAVRRLEILFRMLGERREFFLTLTSGVAGPAFTRRVEAFIESYVEDRRIARVAGVEAALSVPREILPRAISSLFLGLASWWLEHPGTIDAPTMAGHYITLLTRGASAPRPPEAVGA